MGKKFFPNGPTGTETNVYRAFRGYWDRIKTLGLEYSFPAIW